VAKHVHARERAVAVVERNPGAGSPGYAAQTRSTRATNFFFACVSAPRCAQKEICHGDARSRRSANDLAGRNEIIEHVARDSALCKHRLGRAVLRRGDDIERALVLGRFTIRGSVGCHVLRFSGGNASILRRFPQAMCTAN